jgi:uncharacterized protein YhbP (UPF0306 family)
MPIERSSRWLSPERIATTARRLLDASTLCAIATVSRAGKAHVNTAYFAWTRAFDIVWLSDPGAGHSRNLRGDPTIAIAVYDSSQVWGEPDRGIQLFGSARQALGDAARDAKGTYAKRFPAFDETDVGGYRFYRLRPRRMKLFDERRLGAGVFVSATVRRDGSVAWEWTEIYHARAPDLRPD